MNKESQDSDGGLCKDICRDWERNVGRTTNKQREWTQLWGQPSLTSEGERNLLSSRGQYQDQPHHTPPEKNPDTLVRSPTFHRTI